MPKSKHRKNHKAKAAQRRSEHELKRHRTKVFAAKIEEAIKQHQAQEENAPISAMLTPTAGLASSEIFPSSTIF